MALVLYVATLHPLAPPRLPCFDASIEPKKHTSIYIYVYMYIYIYIYKFSVCFHCLNLTFNVCLTLIQTRLLRPRPRLQPRNGDGTNNEQGSNDVFRGGGGGSGWIFFFFFFFFFFFCVLPQLEAAIPSLR